MPMRKPPQLPLISIITISHNAVDFIEQTIKSALSQNYPFIEYIIIDGASTDGTVDIIRRYESRLTYWHSKPDRGIAQAFNLGLEQASGDWLLFLNADDFLMDDAAVSRLVPFLRQHSDADVVYGQAEIILSGKEVQAFPFSRVLGRSWSWPIFRLFNFLPHQSAFTNRRYFGKVGKFDENCSISVDYEHYLRGGKNLKAVFVPFMISKMRLGGVSHRHLLTSLREYKKAQLKNQALSFWGAWLVFYYRILSFYGRYSLYEVLIPRLAAVARINQTPRRS
jgi:glycosyltransferase involved in cell wall biosynthesis